jgi:hypothetical protein
VVQFCQLEYLQTELLSELEPVHTWRMDQPILVELPKALCCLVFVGGVWVLEWQPPSKCDSQQLHQLDW